MKNFISTTIFLLILSSCFCQDTINYQIFNLKTCNYQLRTIINSDSSEISVTTYHPFFLGFVPTDTSVRWWAIRKIPVSISDTLLYCDWDVERGSNFLPGHAVGVAHINTVNNLIIFNKYRWHQENLYDKPKARVFKIQKMTDKNLILIDVTNKNFTRKYLFDAK